MQTPKPDNKPRRVEVRWTGDDVVDIGGWTFPSMFEATFTTADRQVEISAVIRDGVAEVDSVTVRRTESGDPGLTAADLRAVPLLELLEQAIQKGVWGMRRVEDDAAAGRASVPILDALVGGKLPLAEPHDAELWADTAKQARQVTRRRHVTDSLLRDVADVYRKAIAGGGSGWQAVRGHFKVGKSQAFAYLREARQRGILEEER